MYKNKFVISNLNQLLSDIVKEEEKNIDLLAWVKSTYPDEIDYQFTYRKLEQFGILESDECSCGSWFSEFGFGEDFLMCSGTDISDENPESVNIILTSHLGLVFIKQLLNNCYKDWND